MENIKKLNNIIFHNKNIDIYKLPDPIRETQVSKLVFITIPCLKLWSLENTCMYLFTFSTSGRGYRSADSRA